METTKFLFLNHLDAPVRILALTIDEAVVALITLLMLVLASQKILVCLFGAGLIRGLRLLKGSSGPKALLVIAYWYLPRCMTQFFLPQLPPSWQRVLVA